MQGSLSMLINMPLSAALSRKTHDVSTTVLSKIYCLIYANNFYNKITLLQISYYALGPYKQNHHS